MDASVSKLRAHPCILVVCLFVCFCFVLLFLFCFVVVVLFCFAQSFSNPMDARCLSTMCTPLFCFCFAVVVVVLLCPVIFKTNKYQVLVIYLHILAPHYHAILT